LFKPEIDEMMISGCGRGSGPTSACPGTRSDRLHPEFAIRFHATRETTQAGNGNQDLGFVCSSFK